MASTAATGRRGAHASSRLAPTLRGRHQVAADYTLASALVTRIPNLPRLVRGAGTAAAHDAALVRATRTLGREAGHVVTDHRTSWVRRLATPSGDVFVKVYEYGTWASRLRDLARRTGPWARSRAAAEYDALVWLRAHGLPAPDPLWVAEERTCGFLRRAVLVTAAFAGEPCNLLLPTLAPTDRSELARAIGTLVARLHASGFRDRNLDLRNLLARRDADGEWQIAKIDSPRHRLCRAGSTDDAAARADWARLLPQLAHFGVDAEARAAAATAGAGSLRPA